MHRNVKIRKIPHFTGMLNPFCYDGDDGNTPMYELSEKTRNGEIYAVFFLRKDNTYSLYIKVRDSRKLYTDVQTKDFKGVKKAIKSFVLEEYIKLTKDWV